MLLQYCFIILYQGPPETRWKTCALSGPGASVGLTGSQWLFPPSAPAPLWAVAPQLLWGSQCLLATGDAEPDPWLPGLQEKDKPGPQTRSPEISGDTEGGRGAARPAEFPGSGHSFSPTMWPFPRSSLAIWASGALHSHSRTVSCTGCLCGSAGRQHWGCIHV